MLSVGEIADAAAKLAPQDFARLLEDLRDLADGREALAEVEAGERLSTVEEVAARLAL